MTDAIDRDTVASELRGGLGAQLLRMLSEAPGVESDLAAALGYSTQEVVGELDRLRSEGLVARVDDTGTSWYRLADERVRQVIEEGETTVADWNNYVAVHGQSLDNPEQFWLHAAQLVDWIQRPATAHEDGRWFAGGSLNTCYNALDRHVLAGRGGTTALIVESPLTGRRSAMSYFELLSEVTAIAGGLRQIGVEAGDRVVIYMPMIPEAVIAMLACARIGAVHSVVFGGFAAKELAARIDDLQPRVILAASCGVEPNRVVDYAQIVHAAVDLANVATCPVVFVQRDQSPTGLSPGDLDWADLRERGRAVPAECVPRASTDPLYVLYTSGTTGRPKGITRDNGGHAVAMAWSMPNLFGCGEGDVWWAASDIGWVVGHSYIVYAPLIAGATTVLYEGKPVGTPDAANFARVIAAHGVNGFFTSPSALRAIRKQDPDGASLRALASPSLRAVFLAGERLDPSTNRWAQEVFGVPVVDNWWQTETGWPIAINPIGIETLPFREGSPSVPSPGFDVRVLDPHGREVTAGERGEICLRLPLPPGCLSTVWNDDDRFRAAYLSAFPGYYHSGDMGYLDEDGYLFVLGRSDDVINVAGHRLSTGELEAAVSQHPAVAECAVIGASDEIKGMVPRAFVVVKSGISVSPADLEREIVLLVRSEVGPVASLKQVQIVPALPKTRSGKILRQTIRSIVEGEEFTIPSTIEDPAVLGQLAIALR